MILGGLDTTGAEARLVWPNPVLINFEAPLSSPSVPYSNFLVCCGLLGCDGIYLSWRLPPFQKNLWPSPPD